MNILVDADDTLYDTLPAFFKEYNSYTGENVKIEDVKGWDIRPMLKRPDVMDEIFSSPAFFEWLPLKEGSVEMMNWLCVYHDCFIVTAGRTRCFEGKERAFLRDFSFLEKNQISYGWFKGIYKADILIDDRIEFHEQFQRTNPNGVSIVVDMPHNRSCHIPHIRVRQPSEVIEIIKKIHIHRLGIKVGDE